jgi:hypothetical protein
VFPAFEGENKEKENEKQNFSESAFVFHFLFLKRPKPAWLPWLQLGPDVARLLLFILPRKSLFSRIFFH